jgi:hypothetical protein
LVGDRNSDIRKIITRLYVEDLKTRRMGIKDRAKYVSFYQLDRAVFEKPFNQQISDENLKKLGRDLYLMTEEKNKDTHWSAFVVINFDTKTNFSKEDLGERIKTEYRTENNSTEKYGVSITDAGCFFARIISDFEYFACRFEGANKIRLFSVSSLEWDKNKLNYPCLNCINYVKKEALDICIQKLMGVDYKFYTLPKAGGGVNSDFQRMYNSDYSCLYKDKLEDEPSAHPIRIMRDHIQYLDQFRSYIDFLLINELLQMDNYNKIVDKVDAVIKDYECFGDNLIKKNKQYFNGMERLF